MIYGFTWNLNKNEDALRHALDMLAQASGPWIAAFQETPNHAALLTELARRGLADTCLAPGGRAALAIVYSGLTQTASFLKDKDEEYLAARFRAPTSSLDFICVCVHAKSKVDLASDASVGGARALLRHDISRIWDGGRLVLLGDFNSAPTDPEMVDWYCFYGLAPASERPGPQGPRRRRPHETLFSVPSTLGAAQGTYKLSRYGARAMVNCDFFMVDGATFKSAAAEVMTTLSNQPLWANPTGSQRHGTILVSDHLPVEAIFSIE